MVLLDLAKFGYIYIFSRKLQTIQYTDNMVELTRAIKLQQQQQTAAKKQSSKQNKRHKAKSPPESILLEWELKFNSTIQVTS